MRWQGREGSENVEDRRSAGGRRMLIGGGGGLGLLVILVIGLIMGINPLKLLEVAQQNQPPGGGGAAIQEEADPAEEELKQFVSVVLRDTEVVWTRLFQDRGDTYQKPRLVLFRGEVDSACGFASAASGPFYCPADQRVYIDLAFYDELHRRFKAPGDFAQAYVLAHEVGHHVQHQLGISDQVHRLQQQSGEAKANDLSVRLELQADFFAGVWAHHAEKSWKILEPGDVEEALAAASAIGDDTLQRKSQGYVVPDSFTHGTSEQRANWFKKGLQTGDMEQGDTFNATRL
jgi:predicted metalloprotease